MGDVGDVVLVHGAWSRGEQWGAAATAFAQRGLRVHTPTLRHHELSRADGAAKIAQLSLRDYVDDLVLLVHALPGRAVLVGHSLGALLVQLVAARTATAGVIAASPTSAGPAGLNRTTMALSLAHARRRRPWATAVPPPSWPLFREGVAAEQSEEAARAVYDDLVCESARIFFYELAVPWLDRRHAARVDAEAVDVPVLVLRGEADRMVPARVARRTARRYRNGTNVEIPGADHLVFHGAALSATMAAIDRWLAANRLTAEVDRGDEPCVS